MTSLNLTAELWTVTLKLDDSHDPGPDCCWVICNICCWLAC